jgi:hypothetical protein
VVVLNIIYDFHLISKFNMAFLSEKCLLIDLSSNIYKHPEDYIYGRDTFYVESFNNVINVYQNKRIAFGDEQYNTRNNLAV